VYNLIATCARHHAAVHAGLLEVFLDQSGNLICRAVADAVRQDVVESERRKLAERPVAAAVLAVDPVDSHPSAAAPSVPSPTASPGEVAGTPASAVRDDPGDEPGVLTGTPASGASLVTGTPVTGIDPRKLYSPDFLEELEISLIEYGFSDRRARIQVRKALEKVAGGAAPPTDLGLMREAFGLLLEEVPGRRGRPT
jgi:hypothetical protein